MLKLAAQRRRQTEEAKASAEGGLIWRALSKLEETGYNPEIIERRRSLIIKASDEKVRREIRKACADDLVGWVNDWCFTFDPRRDVATRPFILFERQRDYLEWRSQRRQLKQYGLIEKSRDAGLTWLNCCAHLHAWLFEPGYKGSIGSRKEMLVDRLGDIDSIFEKMRYMLRFLPEWMRPAEGEYSTGYLKFVNNAIGASITGEAGDNMGRGGRSSVYDVDEAAFVERAGRVDAAISDNTDIVFYTSTPNGNGNAFAQKRHSGKIEVFSFYWRDDPRKNFWVRTEGACTCESYSVDGEPPPGALMPWDSTAWFMTRSPVKVLEFGQGRSAPKGAIYPWYEVKKLKLDPKVLAQEVDIDYSASIEGVTIPALWVKAAVELKLPAKGPRVAGLDIADKGVDSNVWLLRRGPVVEVVEAWGEGNTTQTAYKARQFGQDYAIAHLNYDSVGVGAGVGGTLSSIARLPFSIRAVNGGDSPSDREWEGYGSDEADQALTAKEIFLNLRAEAWWNVRSRFERTYEHVEGIKEYPLDELISIPNHQKLISELSQPLHRYNDRGKIVLESKDAMRKRGVKSPDYADALVYAFIDPPDPKQSGAAIAGGSLERYSEISGGGFGIQF